MRLNRHRYRWTELWLLLLPAAFLLIGLLELEIVHSQPTQVTRANLPPLSAFTPAFGLIAVLGAAHLALNLLAPDTDQTLLPIAGMLTSIGVIMSLRIGPDIGVVDLGSRQLGWALVGLLFCVATVRGTRNLRWIRNYKYTWAIIGIGLVAVTLVRAGSFSTNAPSRDVLSIGPGSFQPSELLKICLVVFFAAYLSENREMLALGGYRLGPVTLPPLKHLGPLLAMLAVALVIFVVVRELGLAILIFGIFLSLLYVASNRTSYIVGGLLLFGLGAFIAFSIFSYARARLMIVGNAFDPKIANDQGFQIVRGLIAFANGGLLGRGLGYGHPEFVPARQTDFIAAAFGEEFGFAGVLALIGLFMLLVFRGMHIAAQAREPFNQLMAVGLTSIFALQSLVILSGNLKILPLTGIPLPFVAYGGSSLIANFIIIGLLLRLSDQGFSPQAGTPHAASRRVT